ncbi:hypothetical protein ACU4GD_04950 [Cupriavidus basilensis]
MKTWVRAQEEAGKARRCKVRPIAEKESIKWIEGIRHLAALRTRCAETRFVCMGDRESDVYELFAAERPDGVDWLIRAARNRCVRHPAQYLWESVQAMAPLGHTDLLVPARGGMPQRTAHLTLRCAAVRLRPRLGVRAIWAKSTHLPFTPSKKLPHRTPSRSNGCY